MKLRLQQFKGRCQLDLNLECRKMRVNTKEIFTNTSENSLLSDLGVKYIYMQINVHNIYIELSYHLILW